MSWQPTGAQGTRPSSPACGRVPRGSTHVSSSIGSWNTYGQRLGGSPSPPHSPISKLAQRAEILLVAAANATDAREAEAARVEAEGLAREIEEAAARTAQKLSAAARATKGTQVAAEKATDEAAAVVAAAGLVAGEAAAGEALQAVEVAAAVAMTGAAEPRATGAAAGEQGVARQAVAEQAAAARTSDDTANESIAPNASGTGMVEAPSPAEGPAGERKSGGAGGSREVGGEWYHADGRGALFHKGSARHGSSSPRRASSRPLLASAMQSSRADLAQPPAATSDPRRALREAERRAARKERLEVEERNAGMESYGTRRSKVAPGWQAARPNTSGFGSNEGRFEAYWRAPGNRDPTPVVTGPGTYEHDVVGRGSSLPTTIRAAAAFSKNPFRYGETHALRMATSEGDATINDWWCDVAGDGCLRPTARAAHGDAYEPGKFWYRENYAVCEACYLSGAAEDTHGHHAHAAPLEDSKEDIVADSGPQEPGWLRSDYHRFLGFVGRLFATEAGRQHSQDAREAAAAERLEHRERGAALQRAAAEQRREAWIAEEEVRQSRHLNAGTVKREMGERARHRHQIDQQRLEHAVLSAAEIRELA